MYKRIFVPIDTGDTCQVVLAEVKRLASEMQARVYLVKIVDASQFAESPGELIHEIRESDRLGQDDGRHASLLRFLNEAAAKLSEAGITVETRLIEKFGGKFSRAILDEANHWKADLMVIGTHGRSGLSHLLLGSISEEILHHTTIPTLLIKLPSEDADE